MRKGIIIFIICVFVVMVMYILGACKEVYGYEYDYSPNEMVMIGKVVQHEAGNQSELGKRLVIDTIMNRVESPEFPNTVKEVLGQKGQYCDPKDYPPRWVYSLIAQEMYHRTNDKVLWYKTNGYHKYGIPILQEGDHYFSGDE